MAAQHVRGNVNRSSHSTSNSRGDGAHAHFQYTGTQQFSRTSKRRKRKRKRIRIVIIVIVAVLIVLGVCGFMLYRSAMAVMDEARSCMSLVQQVKDKISSGDTQGVSEDIYTLSESTTKMSSEVSSPVWILGTIIPVYGSDISAARTLVNAVDEIVTDALVPMAEDLQYISIDTLYVDGQVDIDSLTLLVNDLSEVASVISSANEAIQSIGTTHIDQLTSIVDTVKSTMSTLASATETASSFAPMLTDMLGADGETRTYLIVAMNNAEIRAAGGFSGAQGPLTITDGAISLGDFQSVLWINDGGSVSITEEEYNLFQGGSFSGEAMTVTSGDAFYNPDFPRSASRLVEFWTYLNGGTIDGVIAVDPVFLQSLLAVTGGVTALDGTYVDGTNAAQFLMSDVYWNYDDGDTQDEIFADVASKAFDQVMNSLDSSTFMDIVDVVQQGTEEGRFLVWMADEDEQEAVVELGCSGEISTDTTTAQTGVYVSNYSYSKLDWYLDLDVTSDEGTLNSDGSKTYQMQVTLTNTLDPELEDSLANYVRAWNTEALSYGDEMLRVHLYAPAGGTVDNVTVSGSETITIQNGTYNGINVAFGDTHLLPGETVTITYTITTSTEAGNVPLDIRVTPTAN